MSMIIKVLITTHFWVVGAVKNLHARHQEEGDPHGGQEPQDSNRKLPYTPRTRTLSESTNSTRTAILIFQNKMFSGSSEIQELCKNVIKID